MPVPTIDLTSYIGLVGTVAAYLNRQDLAPQIPAFIAQHEAKMNRELRVRDMQARVDGNFSGEFTDLPADFLAPYSLQLSAPQPACWGEKLTFVTEDRAADLRSAWLQGGSFDPSLRYYTIYGNEIEALPIPSAGTTPYRFRYYQRVPSLSAINTSNWLLVKAPDLYVAGACLEAAIYLKNDEALTNRWNPVRSQIMDAMRVESEQARFPQSALTATRKSFG